MKLIAITSIGRGRIQPNQIITGTPKKIYDVLNSCFINGCMLEEDNKIGIWKVFAGFGSHVGDIKLEMTDEEREFFMRRTI